LTDLEAALAASVPVNSNTKRPCRIQFEARLQVQILFVELVDLCSQDEIALCQTIDFVRPDGDLNPSPSEKDVRMMTLLLREIPNLVDKLESRAEVRKLEGFCDVVLLNDIPSVHLRLQRSECLTL
jgi:hypothetical protein